MPGGRSWEFTESGGLRFWREDDDGQVTEEVVLNPTTNGRGEIAFTTEDGVSNRGEIEPGAAGDRGVGR